MSIVEIKSFSLIDSLMLPAFGPFIPRSSVNPTLNDISVNKVSSYYSINSL